MSKWTPKHKEIIIYKTIQQNTLLTDKIKKRVENEEQKNKKKKNPTFEKQMYKNNSKILILYTACFIYMNKYKA